MNTHFWNVLHIILLLHLNSKRQRHIVRFPMGDSHTNGLIILKSVTLPFSDRTKLENFNTQQFQAPNIFVVLSAPAKNCLDVNLCECICHYLII